MENIHPLVIIDTVKDLKYFFRNVPFPEEFYKDLQGKESRNGEHSGELGNLYINIWLPFLKLTILLIPHLSREIFQHIPQKHF